jgi:predicted DNA-binding transcriptional regulator AlpA
VRAGEFPASRKIALRSVGWLESEIDTWIQRRFDSAAAGGAQ